MVDASNPPSCPKLAFWLFGETRYKNFILKVDGVAQVVEHWLASMRL
jgi:hypothetical protein